MDEKLTEQLDRLESVLAQKEAELRILRSELEMRNLYQRELNAQLESQAQQIGEFDRRLRELEKH